jgi:hypothetical protein
MLTSGVPRRGAAAESDSRRVKMRVKTAHLKPKKEKTA